MFSKLGGLYADEGGPAREGPGGETFDPALASGDAPPKLEPIDIGHGFSMEEVQDGDDAGAEGEAEAEPVMPAVSKEFV